MVEMTGPWKKFCRIAMRAGLSKTDMADVLGCSRRSVQLWVKNNTAPSERLKPVVLAATDILQKLIDIVGVSIAEICSGAPEQEPTVTRSKVRV